MNWLIGIPKSFSSNLLFLPWPLWNIPFQLSGVKNQGISLQIIRASAAALEASS